MRKPRLIVRICGNPVIATLGMLACGWAAVMAFLTGESWLIGVLSLAAGGFFMDCGKRLQRFGAWQREWDSYAPPRDRAW